jgi:hypothetical protein
MTLILKGVVVFCRTFAGGENYRVIIMAILKLPGRTTEGYAVFIGTRSNVEIGGWQNKKLLS